MKYQILVVDDSKINRLIIEKFLDENLYALDEAENGQEAMALLKEKQDPYDVILLDREMPKMDGIEFMNHFKNLDVHKDTPVIMQTSANEKFQVVEGIDLGVYYYLPKPFEMDVLNSIIKSAIKDTENKKKLKKEVQSSAGIGHLLRKLICDFKTLEDAKAISMHISKFYDDPKKVNIGLYELMANAIEHGNLQFGQEAKEKFKKAGTYKEEMEKRLASPDYKDKKATLEFEVRKDELFVSIEDEGSGFAFEKYLAQADDPTMSEGSRGIALAQLMSFDRIEYEGVGNKVKAFKRKP